MRDFLAEFLGTFTLIIFGVGVNAAVTLGAGGTGDFFSINAGWGIAVMLGVYVAGGVTGAHLNPAVTLALACVRDFPWRKVAPYMCAQLLGAMVASALIYVTYQEAINHYDGGVRKVVGDGATAGIWATYPRTFEANKFSSVQTLTNVPGALIDQVVGTALLLMVIMALGDERNFAPPARLGPPIVGSIVFMIGMSFGLNAGYAINPARDFGPRLFTYIAGWGSEVFTAYNGFWWVPIVGPLIGGVLGALAYDLCITRQHPANDVEDPLGD